MTVLAESDVAAIPTLMIDHVTVGAYIRNTMIADKNNDRVKALMEVYRVMRPGEPPTEETADNLFRGLLFDPERYDLSAVGRVKMNARLGIETDDSVRVLRTEDILAVVKTLVELKDGRGEIDDIDHLGNRRVRSVGELLENQYRVGLLRMERAIRERMSSVEIDTVMPHDLINAKPAASAVREFFGSSQLSAVHGPDQPAQRDHSQAPAVRAWPRRPDARTGRIRGPRRASHALWSHLPDRDARGTEHRAHQFARHLCARQQIRLHRKPLSQGRQGAGGRRGRVSVRDRRGQVHHRSGHAEVDGAGASSPIS